jgi:hypothetical protein
MKLSGLLPLVVCGALLTACADDEPAEPVFRAQNEALDRATQALDAQEAAAAAQREAIDEQSR